MPTVVPFIDLIKYFDDTGHELLIKIHQRYGFLSHFCSDIHGIYQFLIVVLKIENIIEEIIQVFGVRKWDKMAFILFLFLMAGFYEILEEVW